MKLRYLAALGVAALSMSAASSALADESRPYKEGTVIEVTAIRTKPGMFEAYMKWLCTTGKQVREEEKKAGLILDYSFYSARPRTPHDPDLYVTITYKNLAALDGLADRFDPITNKLFGSRDASTKAAIDRESMREILGSEIIRKLEVK
jgi:hypothetical protein